MQKGFLHGKSAQTEILLVEFSTFVKLHGCDLIWTRWRNVMWQILIPLWNILCENMTYHVL